MPGAAKVYNTSKAIPQAREQAKDPCIMVIFGASGDLTKRLLMPAIYNLACDGLLPQKFAIIGTAMDQMSHEQFRDKMTADIQEFNTRPDFDMELWTNRIKNYLFYTPGKFDDPQMYSNMGQLIDYVDNHLQAANLLFYMAVPPSCFGMISNGLKQAGYQDEEKGWRRIIVEKPFGTDLPSALALNKEILQYWREDQIYRVDHYLGKETVQNILTFRFSNGIYEPLWNKKYIDHIQFNVSEFVDVEDRGGYYDKSGVLRDMMQNHMFQMLAYTCMEPPSSFEANAIRDEKVKLLRSVRVMKPEEVPLHTVRGQYGAGLKKGKEVVAYREADGVASDSLTETYAAMRLFIDNWRWEGVPIYLRSGKALWKRGTEILVQFNKAPEVLFRDTPSVDHLEANRLLFHIQPDQGIEFRFHAKVPGPLYQLQNVNMNFTYGESFSASRGTGYEVMIYTCMMKDPTLFSRSDLVETAWKIAQPMLDYWSSHQPADGFPNYPAGSWGPPAAFDLIEKDGRSWYEVINREVLERIPLFSECDAVLLRSLVMNLRQDKAATGENICTLGEMGQQMYIICRGKVAVLDGNNNELAELDDGDVFGEMSLLMAQPRNATVQAKTDCDLFILDKDDLLRVLKEYPQFAASLLTMAKERYNQDLAAHQVFGAEVANLMQT